MMHGTYAMPICWEPLAKISVPMIMESLPERRASLYCNPYHTTAGKPILGQINSNELTDILIIVVRYFGGIKLGTSGLIVAYKAAAAEAIAAATVIEKTVDEEVTIMFEYPFMNDVMRIVKEEEPEILRQSYDMDCSMTLRIRSSMMPKLRARLEKVETARILEED